MPNQKISVLGAVVSVKGSVFWNDGRRRIDIKRPIRDLFEPLKSKKHKVSYVMELSLSKKKTMQRAQKLLDQGVIPILLYFVKESDEGLNSSGSLRGIGE